MNISRQVLIRVVLFILIATLVLVGGTLLVQSQSSNATKVFCSQSWLYNNFPADVFTKVCSMSDEPTFPANSSDGQKDVLKPVVTKRGIVCPAVAKPGVPITISWSCGASSLRAVAGFTVSDKTRSSVTVTPTAPVEVYGIQCADAYESTCSVTTQNPQVRIWSDPVHVRLGARVNIFWEGQDVQACRVTGPSFDEVGIRGGAATVPITAPTTFTAECMTNTGSIVSASVRVDFAQ